MPYSLWGLSSPTRGWTHAPCSGSAGSEALDHQGSSLLYSFRKSFLPYVRSTRFPLRLRSFGVWCSKLYSRIHNARMLQTYMGLGITFINFESTCEDILRMSVFYLLRIHKLLLPFHIFCLFCLLLSLFLAIPHSLWDLSFPTKDWTWALSIEYVES